MNPKVSTPAGQHLPQTCRDLMLSTSTLWFQSKSRACGRLNLKPFLWLYLSPLRCLVHIRQHLNYWQMTSEPCWHRDCSGSVETIRKYFQRDFFKASLEKSQTAEAVRGISKSWISCDARESESPCHKLPERINPHKSVYSHIFFSDKSSKVCLSLQPCRCFVTSRKYITNRHVFLFLSTLKTRLRRRWYNVTFQRFNLKRPVAIVPL